MRIALMVIGLILLVAGIWVVTGHGSYSTTETLAKVGPNALTVTREKVIPLWIGISGIVVGGVLVLAGLLRGKR